MFKFKSIKAKLGTIISAAMLVVFVVVLSYYNIIINDRVVSSSVQLLTNKGIKYEAGLLNEFGKAKTRGDILALFFAKKITNNEIDDELDWLLKSILNNNSNIYRINISYVSNEVISDSLLKNGVYFEKKMKSLNMVRTKNGIIKNTEPLTDNPKIKLIKKNLPKNIKSIVLDPVYDKGGGAYIPILTPIFSGQKYLGYIETDITINWINELLASGDSWQKGIEIYLVICPTCPLSTSKLHNNYFVDNSKLTYCHPIFLSEDTGQWYICFKSKKNTLFELLNYQFWYHFSIGLSLLFLSIGLIFLFVDYLTRPFKKLIGFAQGIAIGDFEFEKNKGETLRKDEVGQLHEAINGISKALKEITDVSNAIAGGDFSKTVKLKSEKDFLAKSINQMNGILKQKKVQEDLRKNDELKQKWFNNGVSMVSEVLKTSQSDTSVLADKIIKNLVEYLDIALGGIYLKELSDEKKITYRLTAAYAYSEKKFVDQQFHSGESLVGSCAAEKRMIYMSNIPDNYVKVFSGLGESAPRSLILLPLINNNEVFGVMELASLNKITETEQEFLQKIAENIANTLSLTQISSQTADLFEKTEAQAIELEKRDMEMTDTLNKLKELQKKTEISEAEVRAKISAMDNTLLVIEYTTDGVLLEANEKFLNTMNYSMDEIKGINVIDLLNENEKRDLVNIINTVKQGNFYEAVVKRHTKYGHEKWLFATYTPIFDKSGATSGILFFAADITRIIAKQTQLQNQIKLLEASSDTSATTHTEIEELHTKQQEKIVELTQSHKEIQDQLFERMNTQKLNDAEKINAYEKMISEIVEQWSAQIDMAEKIINKDAKTRNKKRP